ncbi:hypothetical protein ACF0H5_001236 [Mactra antiquata]
MWYHKLPGIYNKSHTTVYAFAGKKIVEITKGTNRVLANIMMLPVSKFFIGAAGVAASAALLCNVAPWMVAKPVSASLDYLAAGKLQTLDGEKRNFSEAQGLSSLVPEMDARGIRLHAVVHETFGAEEFKPFIKGDVYLDVEKQFYGPQERWMNIPGIFNFKTIVHIIKEIRKGTPGNYDGEGRLLGAVFVIGAGQQGIVYEHHEQVIGDRVNLDDVKKAIEKVQL